MTAKVELIIMRLLDTQIDSIRTLISRHVGDKCSVYLFGSRLNDETRGGDIDLLLETPRHLSRMQRARLKMAIETAVGLPVCRAF